MTSENETVADIVKRVRRDCNSYPLPTAAAEMLKLVREMDAAHQREVAELRECLEQAYGDKIGTYTMKGNEVERWRKALRENERLAYEREAKDGK